MANRPGSASKRLGTASGRPPGTATRLTTGMAPGTASRGAMPGGGVALSSQVTVADRPTTQQGLGGIKTTARGPQRQVQDKSYFLGLLRTKMNELNAEIGRLRKEIDSANEDQSSYVSYEKRAETLANDLKEHQGALADYNTLVDKLNTGESINDIQMDYEDLKAQNDRESKQLDSLFAQKQDMESTIKHLEIELQQEKSMRDNLVADMKPEMRQKYLQLKDQNEHLLRKLETGQQELDALTTRKAELEEELSVSPVKQEAVRLYEQLHEVEEKRDQLVEEMNARSTPQEEREKLLKQVKEDNQEIGTMEKQTKEFTDRVSQLQDELSQIENDIEENQGERSQKYRELKKREETMNDFLENFEDQKMQEAKRIEELESNIVLVMEHMSRNLSRFHHLPSADELENMKSDLAFKETEMKKSEATTSGLAGESAKLQQDLQKVEQLESKINQELDSLNAKINKMTEELVIYSDLDKLKADAEKKKRKLGEDKISLHKRRETLKKVMQHLSAEYDAAKSLLNENETHTQLNNMERKWQHHEQNNFVMKESACVFSWQFSFSKMEISCPFCHAVQFPVKPMQASECLPIETVPMTSTLPWKMEIQYLLTLQVSVDEPAEGASTKASEEHFFWTNKLKRKQVIAAKTMECDYRPLTKQATEMISDYNRYLLDHMAGKPSI